jgi:CPA2 family monovalent cation:H+ antiporter-2
VLARTGLDEGAISETLNSLILTSSLLTIVLTPAAFWVAPRVDRLLSRTPVIGGLFAPRSLILAEEGALRDHAVIVGYGRVGRRLTGWLRETGLSAVVIEQDLRLVHDLNAAGIPAIYGDASYQSILDAARLEHARLVVVALPDSGATRAAVHNVHRANPTVPILVRLPREEDEDILRRSGATSVIAPEFAGALMLLQESLRVLDIPIVPGLDDLGWDDSTPAAEVPAQRDHGTSTV